MSLEAQLTELKEYAEKESLEIIETFIEKKTAKVPGREIFNSMLNKIDGGLPHLIGILAWHPLCQHKSVNISLAVKSRNNSGFYFIRPQLLGRVKDPDTK